MRHTFRLVLMANFIFTFAGYASTNTGNEVLHHLNDYKTAYYQSELALQKFDQELEASSERLDILTTTAYRETLAAKARLHAVSEDIIKVYGAAYQQRYAEASSAEQQVQAERVLREFNQGFQGASDLEKVIFHSLAAEISDEIRAYPQSTGSAHALDSAGFESDERLVAAVVAHRPEMQKRGETVALKASPLKLEVAQILLADGVSPSDSHEFGGGKSVYPSTGSVGNLTGNSFPKGTWALTYDDGPSPEYTMRNVRNLQDFGIKATFFWLAKNIKQYPKVIEGVKSADMSMQNHSYSHPQLSKLGPKGLKREIVDSRAIGAKYIGVAPHFFRCPYGDGVNSSAVRQVIADNDMVHVGWNVDSLDWQDRNPKSVLARVKKQMASRKRGIILFHDIHSQTVEASRLVIESAGDVRWVTIPQIVKELNSI